MKLTKQVCALISVAFVGTALAGAITGSSSPVTIDLIAGVRVAAATEKIIYSPKRNTSSADATAVVSVNGVEVASGSAAGVYAWTPTSDGTYTLTHAVKVNGVVTGETLTATFVAIGTDPIPEIPSTATAADIAKALEGSEDPGLTNNITTVANYNAYRAWAQTVTLVGGGLAGKQAVKESPYAWLSFALDSAVLLTKKPVQGEMTIASFAKNATTGKFDFAVKIEGVNAGTGATAENLAKVFGLEGATEVDGDYSLDNVVFTFGAPVDGKVVISALPADGTATQFFMRVRMKP